jgi:hypothetical protein
MTPEEICRQLMLAAAGGKIDVGAYRLLQDLWRAFGRPALPPR